MVDVLLIAEIAWCTLYLGQQGIRKALVYACGLMVSGYVSGQVSGWLVRTFVPPASPAFHWLARQISALAVQQPVLAQYLPPTSTASGGMPLSQWIAYHVVQALFYVAFTGASLTLFLVGGMIHDALWDLPHHRTTPAVAILTSTLGLASGLYVAAVTAVLLANLSWIGALGGLTPFAASSIGIDWVGKFLTSR